MEDNKLSTSSNVPEDCMSCRLIGGVCFILCSAYVFTKGFRKPRSKSLQITSFIFGSSLGYTGIARLGGFFPFNDKEPKETNKIQ
ncbi:hypothetical protein JTE90_026049 [Oedothorax gibbosus]|uniref:Distal membrane-arm assembly complex protein 1-like domain-containing protein n=1 Tax=Oedothorax gibbosus TaxID=931172 RepID=A0AAV6UD18_9ARAC|nr:hypothetical protein JTE90_026049 [Oedothorax gibbosus]